MSYGKDNGLSARVGPRRPGKRAAGSNLRSCARANAWAIAGAPNQPAIWREHRGAGQRSPDRGFSPAPGVPTIEAARSDPKDKPTPPVMPVEDHRCLAGGTAVLF